MKPLNYSGQTENLHKVGGKMNYSLNVIPTSQIKSKKIKIIIISCIPDKGNFADPGDERQLDPGRQFAPRADEGRKQITFDPCDNRLPRRWFHLGFHRRRITSNSKHQRPVAFPPHHEVARIRLQTEIIGMGTATGDAPEEGGLIRVDHVADHGTPVGGGLSPPRVGGTIKGEGLVEAEGEGGRRRVRGGVVASG